MSKCSCRRSSFRRTLPFLFVSLACAAAQATPVTLRIGALTGEVDPITYTDADGTFTTSALTLSLDAASTSTFTYDMAALTASDHLVMDVSFNNGKSGASNANLSGVFTIDEGGAITPAAPPVLFTTDLDITASSLVGAGEFAGTKAKGKNPTIKNFGLEWKFGPRRTGNNDIQLDLPASFVAGNDVPISGFITATPVPEPAAAWLLAAGVGAVALSRRARVRTGRAGAAPSA